MKGGDNQYMHNGKSSKFFIDFSAYHVSVPTLSDHFKVWLVLAELRHV